jgi:hypothetical protein
MLNLQIQIGQIPRQQIAQIQNAIRSATWASSYPTASDIMDYAKVEHPLWESWGRQSKTIDNSWEVSRGVEGVEWAKIINDAAHAVYMFTGTGLFGPRRRVIRPRRAPFLVFQNRAGRWFRKAFVRGARGEDWITKAYLNHKTEIDADTKRRIEIEANLNLRGI